MGKELQDPRCQVTIMLDREDGTFRAGERITGSLTVRVTEPVYCDELTVALRQLVVVGRATRGSAETDGDHTPVLFVGDWLPGSHSCSFSVTVADELPSYRGRRVRVEHFLVAHARLEPRKSVTARSPVSVVGTPQDGAWFDPAEEIKPPEWYSINDVPNAGLLPLRRLAGGIVRHLLDRAAPPAVVQFTQRVTTGGEIVSAHVTAPRRRTRLRGLRARLRAEELVPRQNGVKRHTVHVSEVSPEVRITSAGTEARFDVPVPADAFSVRRQVVWSVSFTGAWGAIAPSDRWHPLWIGPSEEYVQSLRDCGPPPLAGEPSLAARGWRAVKVTAGLAGGAAFVAVFVVTDPIVGYVMIGSLIGLGGFLGPVILVRRRMARALRHALYRGRDGARPVSVNAEPPAAAVESQISPDRPPPPTPLRLEVYGVDEYEPSEQAVDTVCHRMSEAQKPLVRRGKRGLAFVLALGVAASLVVGRSPSPGWILFGLFSALALLPPVVRSRESRSLSFYVGWATTLTMFWLFVVLAWAVVLAVMAVWNTDLRSAAAALLLVAGGYRLIWGAREETPASAAPIRLLVLWVFGRGSRMQEIVSNLWLYWAYLGPIQFLRGPGQTDDLATTVRFWRGGAREVIADTTASLREHLQRFRYGRGALGLYSRRNAIQCTDAVWRDALNRLLGATDLVLMDLTRFGEHNQGCAYELDVLVDNVPTNRFVLVVDGTTDVTLLRRLLETSWASMAPNSPNRADTTSSVRMIRIPQVSTTEEVGSAARTFAQSRRMTHLLLEGLGEIDSTRAEVRR